MAITLAVTPANYNYSKSPIIARLATNRRIVVNGVKAAVTLNFSSTAAAAGQSLVFVFNQTAVSMVFAAALDDSGNKLRTNTAALSLANFVLQVADDLQSNYYLKDAFTFTTTGTSITITAKKSGTAFTTVALSSATGITVGTVTAGVDEVLAENFKIRLDIYAEDAYRSGVFNKLCSEELEPIGTTAETDLSEKLSKLFEKIDVPAWQQSVHTRCSFVTRRYYIVYTEKYGSPAIPHYATNSDVHHVILGGVSKQEFDYSASFVQWLWTNQKFLSWRENTREINPSGQYYLSMMVPSGVNNFDVQVRITYTDATTHTLTQFTQASAFSFDIWTIPAGIDQLGLNAHNPTKTIHFYEIWCRSGAAGNPVITETKTFYPVYRRRFDFRQFIYNNSLGGLEVMDTTGEVITGTKVEDVTAQRNRVFGDDVERAELFKTFAEHNQVFKASTGCITKNEADVFTELILADQVYIADTLKNQWLPVLVNKGSFTLYQTSADLYAIQFEYIIAFNNRVIEGSKAPPPPQIFLMSNNNQFQLSTNQTLEITPPVL